MRSKILFLTLLLLAGCRAPVSVEQFVKGAGPYSFPLDLSDTTVVYDLDFYTMLDAPVTDGEMPLVVHWKAPSGALFSETVYFPLSGKEFLGSTQVRAPYRAGVSPSEPGLWSMVVSVPDTVSVPGLLGLGLVVTKSH